MVNNAGGEWTRWQGWSGRLRGEALVVLMSRLANVGAGTVFVLLTARHLGPDGRGEIAVAFTLAWATTSVADLGTPTSGRIGILASGSGVTPRDVVSLTVALLPFQAVLSAVVVALLSLTSLHLGTFFGVAVVALSVATMMFNSATSLVYGLRHYSRVLVVEAALGVFQVAALTGLVWTGRLTTTTAIVTMTVGPVLGSIWLVVISGSHCPTGPARDGSVWRRLIMDGLFPMAGSVSLFLALRLDRIVLAVVVGTRSLGLFTVALAVPETLRILPKAVGQVVADRGRGGIDTVASARRHTRLFVAGHLVVLSVAAAIGWACLPFVFGEGFTDARDVLLVVTAAEAVLSIHFMHQALLVGFGSPKGIGLPQVVGAAVMVLLVLLLVPAWGVQGAAWASLLGYTVLAATSTVWTNRELRRIEA